MKKLILLLILISSIGFGQTLQAHQDAKEDFSKKSIGWISGSLAFSSASVLISTKVLWSPIPGLFASSIPTAASYILPILIPPHRDEALKLQSINYRKAYESSYKKEIKKHRMINSFMGSVYGIGVPLLIMISKGGIPVGS